MLNFTKTSLYLIIAFFFCSCCREPLSLFSNYVRRENLASYRIRTPDPQLYCPTLGQRLYVQWNLAKGYYPLPLTLKLNIRFGDRTEIQQNLLLYAYHGNYVYSLLDEEYFKKGGILTYKAEILSDDCVIENWFHQLWVDRISFPEAEAEDAEEKAKKAEVEEVLKDKKLEQEKKKKRKKKAKKNKAKAIEHQELLKQATLETAPSHHLKSPLLETETKTAPLQVQKSLPPVLENKRASAASTQKDLGP